MDPQTSGANLQLVFCTTSPLSKARPSPLYNKLGAFLLFLSAALLSTAAGLSESAGNVGPRQMQTEHLHFYTQFGTTAVETQTNGRKDT